jgi:hypothetical protein
MKLFNPSFNQPLEIEFDKGEVVRLAPREGKEVSDKLADSPVLGRYKNDVEILVEEKPKSKKATDEK